MKIRTAYFDTSVIVKYYIRETGSERARQLMRSRAVITSAVAGLESISAFKRGLASGAINENTHAAIVERFRKHRRQFTYVEVTADILAAAEQHATDLNVRALDAIHLASVARIVARFPKRLPFITADAAQRDAAIRLGLQVLWVE
jgi:predicted nucleic acid-binding protein